MDTLGGQDLSTALTVLRDRLFNDPEPDAAAALLGRSEIN